MMKFEFTVLREDDTGMKLADRVTVDADSLMDAAKKYSDLFVTRGQ